MRLLVAFGAVCLLMLGILAWHLINAQANLPPVRTESTSRQVQTPAQPAAVEQPAELPADEANKATESQSAAPLAVVDTYPSSQATVRWAADPALKDAWRRLALARAALRDDPTHETALRDQLAALIALHGWEEALDTLVRLAALHPDDAGLRFEQATLLMQLQRFVDAMGPLKATLERDPQHARAWYDLAVAHQALGHLAEARAAWDRAIELAPSAAAAARRGEVLLDLHEWAAAAADFEAVLAQESDAPDATLNLALALWKLGRNDEARAYLLALLQAQPRNVPVLNRLAQMAWAECQAAPSDSRRCAEAADWSRQSLALDSQQTDMQKLLDAASNAVSATAASPPDGFPPAPATQSP